MQELASSQPLRLQLSSHSAARKGILVRPFANLGVYPSSTFVTDDAVFYVDEEIIFSAVQAEATTWPVEYHSDWEWVNEYELRLYTSIILPTARSGPVVNIYPLSILSIFEASDFAELTSVGVLPHLADRVIAGIRQGLSDAGDRSGIGSFLRRNLGILPPEFSGVGYEAWPPGSFSLELANQVYDNFDVTDALLLRGMSSLLRSHMLWCQYELFEESYLNLYVALDASMYLIARHMKRKGFDVSNIASDTGSYIDKVFNGRSVSTRKYFEDYYEDRIRLVHPSSRFGTAPYSELGRSYYSMLWKDLREVYLYLLTGHVESDER